jgi:HD superfamily phosphodiesterase
MKSDQLPDFSAAEEHIKSMLKEKMPNLQYHNIDHILDVLDAAVRIGENEKLNDDDIKLLRLAALLHDIGFIHSSINHEDIGAEMVKTILPAFGFSDDQVKVIQHMIIATRIPQSPKNKL